MDDMFVFDDDEIETKDVVIDKDACTSMDQELKVIWDFVNEMKSTTKTNDKRDILEKVDNPVIKKALLYTLNPYWKYHVTPKNCEKHSDLVECSFTNLWELLDALTARVITGHDAIAAVNGMINLYPDYEELIFSIINKNLKIRASANMVNKVWDSFIPSFDVSLGHPFQDKRACWKTERWYGSRKLDGVRCVMIYNHKENTVKAYSREGHEFFTVDRVKDDILKLGLTEDWVFDGELCIIDETGLENFPAMMKEIKKKDHTIENPSYVLFDCLTKKEFDDRVSETLFSERIEHLRNNILGGAVEVGTLKMLNQEIIKGEDHITEMISNANDMGFEGIIVRKDTTYQGKRSYDLMKIKTFIDEEFRVVSIESDVQRFVENGVEIEEVAMAKANVQYKNNIVGVGSGWTKEQRRLYHATPELLIGRVLTVQHFGESVSSATQLPSLRHPVVKHVWGFERDL